MKIFKVVEYRELIMSNASEQWQKSLEIIEYLRSNMKLDSDDLDVLLLEEAKAQYGKGDRKLGFSILETLAKSNSLQCGLSAKYLVEFQSDISSAKILLSKNKSFSGCANVSDSEILTSIESCMKASLT